jgi:predicted Zn-dependent peptidase
VATVQKSTKDELSPQNNNTKSKADRLRELKKLLDEKIITQEEFEKEKKKILDENN